MPDDDKNNPADKSQHREADGTSRESISQRDLLGKSDIDDKQVASAATGRAREASTEFENKLKSDSATGKWIGLPPAEQLLAGTAPANPAVVTGFSSLVRSHLSAARHGGGDRSTLVGAPGDPPASDPAQRQTELDRKLNASFSDGNFDTVGRRLLHAHAVEAAERLGIPPQLITLGRIQLGYPGYGMEGITGRFQPGRFSIEVFRQNGSMVSSLEHELRHAKRTLDIMAVLDANPDLARRLTRESAIESVGTGKPILAGQFNTQPGLAMAPEHAETMRAAMRKYLDKVPAEKAHFGMAAEFILTGQPGFEALESTYGGDAVRKEFAAQLKHVQLITNQLLSDRASLIKQKDVDEYLKQRGEELRTKHGDKLAEDPTVRRAFRHISDDKVGMLDAPTYFAGSSEEMTATRHGATGELRQLLKEAKAAEKAAADARTEMANRSWLSPGKWLESASRVFPGLSPNRELYLTAERARERYEGARTHITNEIQQTNRLQKVLTELREMDKSTGAERTRHFEAARTTALEFMRHIPAEYYEREERAAAEGERSPHGIPQIVKHFESRGLLGSSSAPPSTERADRRSVPSEGDTKLEAGRALNQSVRDITAPISEAQKAGQPLSAEKSQELRDRAVREVLLPEARQIAKRYGLDPNIITEKNLQLMESLPLAAGSYDTSHNTIKLSLDGRDLRSTLEHEISHMHDAIVTTAIGHDALKKILQTQWLDHVGSGEVLLDGTRRMKLDGGLRQEMRDLTCAAMEKFGTSEPTKRQVSDWLAEMKVSNEMLTKSGNKARLALELWAELNQYDKLVKLNTIPESTIQSNKALSDAIAKERARQQKFVADGKPLESDPYVKRVTETAVRDLSGRGGNGEEYRFSMEEIRARRRQAAAELKWLTETQSSDASLRDAAIKDARERISYANVSEKLIREFESAQRLSTSDPASHLAEAKAGAQKLLTMSDPKNGEHQRAVQFLCNAGLITREEALGREFKVPRPSTGTLDSLDGLADIGKRVDQFAKRMKEGPIRSDNLTVVKDAATGRTDYIFNKPITVEPKSAMDEVTVVALHEKDGEFTATIVDNEGKLHERSRDQFELAFMHVTEDPRFAHSHLTPEGKAHFYAGFMETIGHKSELPRAERLAPPVVADTTKFRDSLPEALRKPEAIQRLHDAIAKADLKGQKPGEVSLLLRGLIAEKLNGIDPNLAKTLRFGFDEKATERKVESIKAIDGTVVTRVVFPASVLNDPAQLAKEVTSAALEHAAGGVTAERASAALGLVAQTLDPHATLPTSRDRVAGRDGGNLESGTPDVKPAQPKPVEVAYVPGKGVRVNGEERSFEKIFADFVKALKDEIKTEEAKEENARDKEKLKRLREQLASEEAFVERLQSTDAKVREAATKEAEHAVREALARESERAKERGPSGGGRVAAIRAVLVYGTMAVPFAHQFFKEGK